MKEISKKLTRYSTAVGALLAVSANANAAVIPGTFNHGRPDLDRILDHDEDVVFIDINNDGTNDFYGSFSSSGPFASAIIGGMGSNNSVANESSGSEADLTKFVLNDLVGPSFDNSYSYGYIFDVSRGGPTSPGALGDPFNDNNDGGYVGVVMHSGSGDQFGWIQIAINGDSEVEFIASASESLYDTPISAGDTPVVPLLPIASAAGLGLVGLMAALKRKKKSITI